MSLNEYPTYTRVSPQGKVRERLGRIETKGGKRHFVPAKPSLVEDTGLPFLTFEEKAAIAKANASKSPMNGKRKTKGRYNFHQRQHCKNEVSTRRSDKDLIERALARKAKGYI